jgi:predicted membrane-bound spermidine synthase
MDWHILVFYPVRTIKEKTFVYQNSHVTTNTYMRWGLILGSLGRVHQDPVSTFDFRTL